MMRLAVLYLLLLQADPRVPAAPTPAPQTPPEVHEEVTVAATRTNKRIDDVPMRVEVLGREEIEEKMLMTPGDIVMMLNEMGGMRVQATSPNRWVPSDSCRSRLSISGRWK
jgi:outer membrane receptor for ferrienterochelin and colicins